MTPNELLEAIASYLLSSEVDIQAFVIREMAQLYREGYAEFFLEDGGKLTLSYDPGNTPCIRLSSDATLEYRLVQYIAEWLDYNWKRESLIELKPFYSTTVGYTHRKLNRLKLEARYSDTPKLFTPAILGDLK